MKEGSIVAKGTPEQLKNDYSTDLMTISTERADELSNLLMLDGLDFDEEKSLFHIRLSHTRDAIPILEKFTSFISSFEVKKSSLDDVFIAINGKAVNHDDRIR